MNRPQESQLQGARGSIDAILPLKASGSYDVDDLGRTKILLTSLSTFFDDSLLKTLLIVSPAADLQAIRQLAADWPQLPIEVMSEEALVPETASYPKLRGWRRQQLIKLAASRALGQPFCITFDADIFCTRPVTYEQLVPSGRALLQYEARSRHPKWWRSSARLLEVDPAVGDKDRGMSITPAILSRDILESLTAHLSTPRRSWVEHLCQLHRPTHPSNWTLRRLLRSKWTEYSLYYLHAAATGMLADYHVECGTQTVPQTLLGHEAHPFETWQPSFTFGQDNPALFCLVGSKSRTSPARVWEAVGPYLEPNGEASL